MSKHNNANWDHYKVAGREHPVDDVHHDQQRQQFSGSKAHGERADAGGPHIPNEERASQPRADGSAARRRVTGRPRTRRTSAGPRRSSPR